MKLSHFYGCSPSLSPAGVLSVGGELIELRPLRAVDVWELWDEVLPYVEAWAGFFMSAGKPAEERDLSWIEPVFRAALRVLWREKGEAWAIERANRATPDELLSVYKWYVDNHDWRVIFMGLLGIDIDQPHHKQDKPKTDRNAVEILFELSDETGIRIEDMIGMRAEAYVSFTEAASKVWSRQAKENEAAANGEQVVSIDDLFNFEGLI